MGSITVSVTRISLSRKSGAITATSTIGTKEIDIDCHRDALVLGLTGMDARRVASDFLESVGNERGQAT